MQKKIKQLIIVIIIFILIIIGILIYLLTLLNKEGQLGSKVEEKYETDQDIHFRSEIEKVTSKYDYFDTIACIEKYTNLLQRLDASSYQENSKDVSSTIQIYKQELYELLDPEYIKQYSLKVENIEQKFSDFITSNLKFQVENMYVIDAEEELPIYFAYGKLVDLKNNKVTPYGFIVKRDTQNLYFTITPYDYMIENGYEQNQIANKDLSQIKKKTIQKKDSNYYVSNAYDEEYVATYYFNNYKINLQANVEDNYQKMEKEYREKRFGTLQDYKNYVANYAQSLLKCNMNQYTTETEEKNKNYICKDQFDNYYIFKETNIGEYTLMLDTYTLPQEKFKEKYEIATNNEKVAMNLTEFFQRINTKDYKSAYTMLSNGFKNSNFKTQQSFEQYIKAKLYSYNDINFVNFSDEISGVFTYYIEISNKEEEKDKKIKMNIIMELLEDSKYQLSFEIVD